MGIEDLGLLLENIEEYVMVEKKVVTYKWLSRVFSLNVNQAKQLLCIFHMKHKNMKHKSIQGVYYVSGMRTNSAGQLTHQICIVPEDDLESTKAQLDPLTGVHLYSVQKGKPKDTAPLYAVDFEQLKKKVFETTEFSMVQCDEAKISQVINSALRPVTPPALKNKVTVLDNKKTNKVTGNKFEAKKAAPVNKTAPLKTAVKTTAKPTTKPSTTKTNPAAKKPAVKPKQDNLANFFSKGKAEPKKPVTKTAIRGEMRSPKKSLLHNACVKEGKKEVEEKRGKIRITSPGKRSKPLEPPALSEEEMETEEKEVEKNPEKKDSKKREVKLAELSDEEEKEEEKKEVPEKKYGRSFASKRKRVRKFSDEEEKKEEDQGICLEEEEDQFVMKEEKSPECKKSRANGEKRRKRVKKLVSKTKVNEEGFMETEKVWEEESCTDDEEEQKEEKEEKVEEKKSAPVFPRNKQSNMMSFFKKS